MAAIGARTFRTTRAVAHARRQELEHERAIWRPRVLFWLGICLRVLFAPMPLRTGESKPDAEIEQAQMGC